MLFDDVAGDRQAEPGPAGLAADPRPVDLVEALEDPRLGRPRDADAVIGHGADDPPPSRDATATVTSPPSGLNLTALWSRLTKTWPRRAASPRTRRQVGRRPRPAGSTPWRSAKRRSRSVESVAIRPRSTRSTTRIVAAALDPGQVEQLADHLDEVAGLDLDLADPVAHLRRDRVAGRVGLAGQRLGQQADRGQRRSQLVRQVVDELGPDLLEPTQLGDVLEDQPDAAGRRPPGPDQQPSAVGLGRPISPVADPASSAGRAIVSTWTSRNASISVRPISAARRPSEEARGRRRWRRRSAGRGSTVTTPWASDSISRSWSCRSAASVGLEPVVLGAEGGHGADRVAARRRRRRRSRTAAGRRRSRRATAAATTSAADRRRSRRATAPRREHRTARARSVPRRQARRRPPDARRGSDRPGTRPGRHGARQRLERRRREGVAQHEQVGDRGRGAPRARERRAASSVGGADARRRRRGRRAPTRRAGASSSSGEVPGGHGSSPSRSRVPVGRQGRRRPPRRASAAGGSAPRTAGAVRSVARLADGRLPAAGQPLPRPLAERLAEQLVEERPRTSSAA